MKTVLKFFFFCFPLCLFSQSQLNEAVRTAGNFDHNEELSLQWTIGEIAYHSRISSALSVTEGFNQSSFEIQEIEITNNDLTNILVNVFPNPVSNELQIDLGSNQNQDIHKMQFVSAQGQILIEKMVELHQTKYSLNVSQFSIGTYYLQLKTAENKSLKSFKIIKTNK